MTEFGVASNIGTSVFVITVVPAVAILMTMRKDDSNNLKQKEMSLQEDEQTLLNKKIKAQKKIQIQEDSDSYMMATIFRDLGFFMAGLILYEMFLQKGIIYFHEACALLLIVILYIVVIFKMEKFHDQSLKLKKHIPQAKDQEQQQTLQPQQMQMSTDDRIVEVSQKESDMISFTTTKNEDHPADKESKFLHSLEILCWPVMKICELILPVEKYPMLAFFLIVVAFFVSMDFILTVVTVMSIYAHLSHIFIGLTIISWGSSPIELINLIISSKKGELQIGLTSILSGVVFTFFILMPLAMIFKMIKKETHEIEILQPFHSSHIMFLPALLITVLVTCIFWKTRMNLGFYSSFLLIASYVGYIGYMYAVLSQDRI